MALSPTPQERDSLSGRVGRPAVPPYSIVIVTVHELPGRVRLRLPALRRPGARAHAQGLIDSLQAQPGITRVVAKTATGSLLLEYDPHQLSRPHLERLLPQAVQEWLERWRTAPQPDPQQLERMSQADAAPLDDPTGPLMMAATGLTWAAGRRHEAASMGLLLALLSLLNRRAVSAAAPARAQIDALLAQPVNAVRKGQVRRLPAWQLRPGDLLPLTPGQTLLADASVLASRGLAADEHRLTGESQPVDKRVGEAVWAGSTVVRGEGLARVVAAGPACTLGRIGQLLSPAVPTATFSPTEVRIRPWVNRWRRASFALATAVAGLSLARGLSLPAAALNGVTLALAAVADGLFTFTQLALRSGRQRLARQGFILDQPATLDRLGCVDVVCCDKTGTLTTGEMSLQHAWVPSVGEAATPVVGTPDHQPASRAADPFLLKLAALSSDAQLVALSSDPTPVVGDPVDIALLLAAAEAGVKVGPLLGSPSPSDTLQRLNHRPFSARRQYSEVRYGSSNGQTLACRKGAPERVVPACVWIRQVSASARAGAAIRPMTEADRRKVQVAAARMAQAGQRVLAIAYSPGSDWVLAGLVGLADPPRPQAAGFLKGCQHLGLPVVVLTGDRWENAQSLLLALGVEGIRPGDPPAAAPKPPVLILARMTPDGKQAFIRRLQRSGHVVAMVGDGFNDAPALATADVGIAVASTADARPVPGGVSLVADPAQLGDLPVLFSQARHTRCAVEKIAQQVLATHVASLTLLGSSLLLGLPAAITPLQLLLLQLGLDLIPASRLAASASTPPHLDVEDSGLGLPASPQPAVGRARSAPLTPDDPLRAGAKLGLLASAIYAAAAAGPFGRRRPLPLASARALALATLVIGRLDGFRQRILPHSRRPFATGLDTLAGSPPPPEPRHPVAPWLAATEPDRGRPASRTGSR